MTKAQLHTDGRRIAVVVPDGAKKPASATSRKIKATAAAEPAATYSLRREHPLTWAFGQGAASAGAVLADHPIAAIAVSAAAFAGAYATGLIGDKPTGWSFLAMVPLFATFLNWASGNGLAAPLVGKGMLTVVRRMARDLYAAVAANDVARAEAITAELERLNVKYMPIMIELGRSVF